MKIIVDIFSSVMQLLIVMTFFSMFGTKRDHTLIKCILFPIVCVASQLLIKNQLIFTTIIVIAIIFLSFQFKMGITKRIYSCLLIVILLLFGEIMFSMFYASLYGITVELIQANVLIYLQAMLLSKLSIYIVIRLIRHFVIMQENTLSFVYLLSFIIRPLTSFFVIYLLAIYGFESNSKNEQILIFLASLLLVLSNLFVFFVFDYLLKQKNKERKIMAQALQLKHEKEYYNALYEKQQKSNISMHDIKNQIFALKNLIDKEPLKAKKEIDELFSVVSSPNMRNITNVEAVDALLYVKEELAKSKGIDVDLKSFSSEFNAFDCTDLCIIIGNLFDNCIEACEKVSKEKNRSIYVEFKQNKGYLSITFSNNFEVDVNFPELETTKPEKLAHGFGLISVKNIVKKYNGEIKFSIVDSKFIVNIIMVGNN